MTSFGTAMRRSGSILKSITSSHSELVLVIEQLKEIRNLCKATAAAQVSLNNDLTKWAENENRAIQDTVANIGELLAVYASIQTTMGDHLKEFRHQFLMISEGARAVDSAKQKVAEAEEKETRQRREFKKALKKSSPDSPEVQELKTKLDVYSNVKESVQVELGEIRNEHEAVKMIRLKTGLTKLSRAKQESAVKTNQIFKAIQDVANLIPDVPTGSDMQEMRYNGAATAVQIVSNAKAMLEVPFERIQEVALPMTHVNIPPTCKDVLSLQVCLGVPQSGDDPPPYAEVQPPTNPYYHPSTNQNPGGVLYPIHSLNNAPFFPTPNLTLETSTNSPNQTVENLSRDDCGPVAGRHRRFSQLFSRTSTT